MIAFSSSLSCSLSGAAPESKYLENQEQLAYVSFVQGSLIGEQLLTRELYFYLKKNWLSSIKFLSSIDDIEDDKHYKIILSLGERMLPIIIEDLITSPSMIYLALYDITGQDPVKAEHVGLVKESIADWISWAKKNRIC